MVLIYKRIIIDTMKKKNVFGTMVLLLTAVLAGSTASGQTQWSQQVACPGWNNPSSFTQGGALVNKYSGQGVRIDDGTNPNSDSYKPCPNPLTGETGVTAMTTTYTAAQMASVQSTSSSCSGSGIPDHLRQFRIMTESGYDPNTGNNLKYVPTQFNTNDTTPGAINTNLTKSIRIGDGCSNGNGNAGDPYGGAMLNYTMRVTEDNAMMYIYYAIVAEAPGHGQRGNPTFIIRAMKKNNAGNWTQISDTLAYYISSTPSTDHSHDCVNMGYVTFAANNESGWHQASTGYNGVVYKDWEKVCINLSNHLYDTLQIQVLIYDCWYNAHYAYAYIAGECRPMTIQTAGCPPGLSTDVTTLTAATNMRNYVWYASEWGVGEPANAANFGPGGDFSHYTWRQLTPNESTNHIYHVQASDFRVTRRLSPAGVAQAVDSMGNQQTFRCKMTSALDPSKPFDSYLYVNVQNTKPTMDVDSLFMCDGTAKLWNRSYVPGDPTLVVNSQTQWSFYNNPFCEGTAIDTVTGDSAEYVFTDTELKGVRVRTFTTDPSCYSDAIYRIQPREHPNARMTISAHVLCDADETTMIDSTSGDNTRMWIFRSAIDTGDVIRYDTLRGEGENNRSVTRPFTHAVEPIKLVVNNGTYFVDMVTGNGDTVWCTSTVMDTVSVFLHPELEVTGDTVVCQGSQTNATVRALGVEGCTYEWSRTYGTVTGGLPSGPTLCVTPYADTATYFVKVTSPQECVAWDSIHAYVVRPQLEMLPVDGRICPGDVATLTGHEADHYTWSASPADPSLAGQESSPQIRVSPSVTTVYTMVGHGTNNCNATPLTKTVTIVPLPVPSVKLTPGFIDTDNPKVVLRDQSTYGVASSWLFNNGEVATGREVSHSFDNCIGFDSVPVTLTSYNALNCPTEYPFQIPVNVFTVWFPSAFTPGSSDGNDKFTIHTINEYQYFHIYIYNRRGELVYDSDDVHFEWDGTYNGDPCPQGAYVYICRFRKPGTTTLSSVQGTVTIIR